MRNKSGVLLMTVLVFANSFVVGQSPFSTSFTFHWGMLSGGLNPSESALNPMAFKSLKDNLTPGYGFNFGLGIEQIKWKKSNGETKPNYGFRVGFQMNKMVQDYEKNNLSGYEINYTRIPVELMYCIFSKKAYLRDEDEIRISGDNITFHKGLGVIQTRSSVFLTAGASYGAVRNVKYQGPEFFQSYNYNDSFELIRPNISKKDPAIHVGIEYRHSNIGFHFFYMSSINSFYKTADIRNKAYGLKIKLIL